MPEKRRHATSWATWHIEVPLKAYRTVFHKQLTTRCTAYWIAFGPHGPRAGTPPGETTKVVTYTAIAVAAGAAIFLLTHHFGRPPPSTMTKEWQEATNEYFQVRTSSLLTIIILHLPCANHFSARRRTGSSPSLDLERRDTKAPVWCRASQQHKLVPNLEGRSNIYSAYQYEPRKRRLDWALSSSSQSPRFCGRVANERRGGKGQLYLKRMPLYKSQITNGTVAKLTCSEQI